MAKFDKSVVLKYYTLFSILGLASYNIITHDILQLSNIFIQLAISLNIIFSSYYLLYKDNVILNGSDNLKSFFVACTSEYLLVWAFVELLGKSHELTTYYTNYIYFGLILMHLGLYQRYPKVFDKFLKFSFGFTYSYFCTHSFLKNYNIIHILISLVTGIMYNVYNTITLTYMTIIYTNFIYSVGLFEAIYILTLCIFINHPKDDDFIFTIRILIVAVSIGCIFGTVLSRVIPQLDNLKNKGNDGEPKDEKLPMSF